MHYSILLPVWGLVALALYKIVSWVAENRRHAAKAKEWGCKEALMFPGCGFMGLKMVKRLQAADERKQFPDCLVDLQNEMNAITGRQCSTYRQFVMGQPQYITQDPENVKAMLATQFADYDLGPARRGNMMQTLVDGIFVQDGKP